MREFSRFLAVSTIVGLLDYSIYLNGRGDLMPVAALLSFGVMAYGFIKTYTWFDNNFGGTRVRVYNEQTENVGIGDMTLLTQHSGLARDLNRAGLGKPKKVALMPGTEDFYLPFEPVALAKAIDEVLTPEQKSQLLNVASEHKKALENKSFWFQ